MFHQIILNFTQNSFQGFFSGDNFEGKFWQDFWYVPINQTIIGGALVRFAYYVCYVLAMFSTDAIFTKLCKNSVTWRPCTIVNRSIGNRQKINGQVHCVKRNANTEFFLVHVFRVFGLNTGKYGPQKTQYLDTFHAVVNCAISHPH